VPTELAKWTKAGPGVVLPGLVRRRKAEADLFTRGTYGA
jgi:GH24 family phage-related lysozyme (muramidase)